ncbi:hypothetical protein [Clostridium cellulovorans]|uniref:Uncharacterized protein n=1 Tax=Clostridium cellulovorans (strain ATCC 35296 / DSM 3052 / OCM 3 / 743B) TaxID=573061 RepID=D9SSF6_CLOC7|nr:hypothetical protein [Clostridium cellulovorans]ADL50553.1 hypothetical protein Clocel_0783 [Clostridium cellulovorans 743B]
MKITDLKVPGAIFASAITTSEIELNNYKEVTFLVESGEGTAGNTTITVEGKTGATGTTTAVPFLFAEKGNNVFVEIEPTGKQVSIGGTAGTSKFYLIKVTDRLLASKEFDRVVLKTTAVASSTVVGAIYAISDKPRFSE